MILEDLGVEVPWLVLPLWPWVAPLSMATATAARITTIVARAILLGSFVDVEGTGVLRKT